MPGPEIPNVIKLIPSRAKPRDSKDVLTCAESGINEDVSRHASSFKRSEKPDPRTKVTEVGLTVGTKVIEMRLTMEISLEQFVRDSAIAGNVQHIL